MKKFSSISESTWNDIRKQSAGKQSRMEDHIDMLDHKGLYEYINTIYKTRAGHPLELSPLVDEVALPLFRRQDGSTYWIYLDNPQCGHSIVVTFKLVQGAHDVYTQIKANYDTDTLEDYEGRPIYLKILPKGGGEITNSFFMEVVDMILTNLPKQYTKDLIRKDVNESTWNDIRKQASGAVERKEDSIEDLDRDGLYDLIYDTYEVPVKKVTNLPSKPKKSESNSFAICLFDDGTFAHRLYARFNEDDNIEILILFAQPSQCLGFYKELHDAFNVEFKEAGTQKYIKITDKDGSVTNKLCMEVIDLIVNTAEIPLLKKRVN